MAQITKSIELIAKPLSFEKLNSQLTKCRCYVLASGRNANYSDITIDAIKNSIPTIYNMPVVANLKMKDDGSGWCVGAHDAEVIWSSDGDIAIRDLTVPFGVVPENCKPTFEDILEPDGITKNTYLAVDMLLWTGRYNIMDAAYSDDIYFNQSCEILIDNGYEDKDGYYVIQSYNFSALCLLNKSSDPQYNRLPCFPSARVEPIKYSLNEDSFRKNFALLMQEIKRFNAPDKSGNSDESGVLNITKNDKKEDDTNMADTIFTAKIADKIKAALSEAKFRTDSETYRNKYDVLAITDNDVAYMDKEDAYRIYSSPYVTTKTSDNEDVIVSVDFGHKIEKSFVVGDKTEMPLFDFQKEIDGISAAKTAIAVNEAIKEPNEKLGLKTAEFDALMTEYQKLQAQIAMFVKEKDELLKKNENDAKDAIVNSYEDILRNNGDYNDFRSKDYYVKTREAIEQELKVMLANQTLEKDKKFAAKFSFNGTEAGIVGNVNLGKDPMRERYGDAFDNYGN